jgi:hypothetical protein
MIQTIFYQPNAIENELLIKEDFIQIYYNFVYRWLFVRWEGQRSTENIQKGASLILKFMEKTKSKKMIIDSTCFQQEAPEAAEWIINKFVPQLEAAGMEYVAWIFGEDSEAFPFADKILTKETSDIIVLNFDTIRLAEVWLKSVG